MFENLKNLFMKGGAKLGMVEELGSITDHPKIAVSEKDYRRIQENIMHYRSEYPQVNYINSNNQSRVRDFHSLNIPKVLARKMAKLVFNEGVEIAINNEQKEDDDFIQGVFNTSKFRKNFGEELEAGYAVGGLVLRPYFDSGMNQIKIAYSKPDAFFPLQSSSNDISEMAFSTMTVVQENKKTVYYTLLEFHEWENGLYIISNELWRSEDAKKLGRKAPMASLDKYKNHKERITMAGFSRPLFVYIKLAGKNNKNLYSPLSLGIIDNSKQQINDLNEKYDQFMNEIKQSERKIIASEHFFRTQFDNNGQPRYRFDEQTTAYKMIRSDEPSITEFSPSLRSAEFIESIDFILKIIELQSGFSAGTFSFDGQSVKTATEIISENSETYSTRSDNVQIVEEAMKELITSIFELASYHGLYKKPKNLEISVDFDDGVFQSQDAKIEYYGKATTFGFIPTYKAIASLMKVDDKTAMEYFKQIQNERMGIDPMEKQATAETDALGIKE